MVILPSVGIFQHDDENLSVTCGWIFYFVLDVFCDHFLVLYLMIWQVQSGHPPFFIGDAGWKYFIDAVCL